MYGMLHSQFPFPSLILDSILPSPLQKCVVNDLLFISLRRKSRGPLSTSQQLGSSDSAEYPTARGLVTQQKRVLPQ